MTPRRRLAASLVIALVAFVLALAVRQYSGRGDGDFSYIFCEARAILRGDDSYAVCQIPYRGYIAPSYPLTAALVGIAFLPLEPFAAPAILSFYSGLLAWGLLRNGEKWKLMVFASAPFIMAFWVFQWSPLIAALYLTPAFLPLAIIKPTIGLPAILLRLNRYRLVGLIAFAVFPFLLYPDWLPKYLHAASTYDGWIPLLRHYPAFLLPLVLLRWRDERAWLVLLMSMMPQRGLYDLTPLMLLPATRRQMYIFTAAGWVIMDVIGNWDFGTLVFYLVAFVLVLATPKPDVRPYPETIASAFRFAGRLRQAFA